MSKPAPMIPADCDLRDFYLFQIDTVRLFASVFHATANNAEWRAGLTLWMRSWDQVPAGSLPNDPSQLALLADFGRDVKKWLKVSAKALRGWIECSDGRLYHPVMAERALIAWMERLALRLSSGAGNARRWKTPFDPAPIQAKIEEAMNLLATVNPNSKGIVRQRNRQSRRDRGGIADGNAGGSRILSPSPSLPCEGDNLVKVGRGSTEIDPDWEDDQ